MKPAILKPQSKPKPQGQDQRPHRALDQLRALVALLAMATLPLTSRPARHAVQNTTHWSDSWHG